MTTTPHFSVATEATGDKALFSCVGEVDLSNVHLLRQPLQAHLRAGRHHLTVDLRQVGYLDSAALGVLLGVARVLLEQGERLRVVATPHQQRLFMLVGCSSIVTLISAAA
jgi:anti-sigma B factor antagonist